MSHRPPVRYIIAGITDERDTCECCGKTNLKRVVVLLDLDTDEYVFYGTTCADRNTGRDDTAKVAKKRGKPGSALVTLLQHHERKAEYFTGLGRSILKMSNGNANSDTRDGADQYFRKAQEERKKAVEIRGKINRQAAEQRAAAESASSSTVEDASRRS